MALPDDGFTPGEYVAYREFLSANERLDKRARHRAFVRSSKELLGIGKATGVAFWHLEAGLMRATELLHEGRPNAANAAARELAQAINSDALVSEIKALPEWRHAEKLMGITEDAPGQFGGRTGPMGPVSTQPTSANS